MRGLLFLALFLELSPNLVWSAGIFAPVIEKRSGALAHLNPHKAQDLAEILSRVSGALLGKPYQVGPLGEGSGSEQDPDPLYRLDAFDCTTFMETLMANAYCFQAGKKMSSCLASQMQKIRYGGSKISFRERNHIPELDWLPHNVQRGYLKDLNLSLFPGEWHSAVVAIDRELWLSTQMKGENKVPAAKTENPKLSYIPAAYFFTKKEASAEEKKALGEKLAAAQKEITAKTPEETAREKFRAEMEFLKATYKPIEERLRQIPSGTVLNLVHAPVKDSQKAKLTPIISHQGLVIQLPDGAHIRHAAVNVGHVSDQLLGNYLLRFAKSANYRGISLYQIVPK